MKIEDIITENKERDYQIIQDWLDGIPVDGMEDSIANKNQISATRVYAIIKENKSIINVDRDEKKNKRIARLERIARTTSDKINPTKDILNVLEQLRKEIEGDKPLIEQHTHITKDYRFLRDSDSVQAPRLSTSDSQQP